MHFVLWDGVLRWATKIHAIRGSPRYQSALKTYMMLRVKWTGPNEGKSGSKDCDTVDGVQDREMKGTESRMSR